MTGSPRIAIGRLWQETNTFSEQPTTLDEFRQYTFLEGEDVLGAFRDQDDELAGFADVLDPLGASYVPLISASTWPGGPAQESVIEAARSTIAAHLEGAERLDAVLFSFHGAMAGIETRDVEGNVMVMIRDLVGPEVPVVITLDHHANVTSAMVRSCNALTAYRHCPHVDMRETGRRGARLLLSMLDQEIRPAMAYRKIPLVTPCEAFLTAEGPMEAWFDLAREAEGDPRFVDVSLFPVQPWLDVPEFGWSVVVTTDDRPDLAADLCGRLADFAWDRRDEFYVEKYEPAEAIRRAATAPEGPVVIPDGADATNGGSPGDSTCLLREMLRQGITCPALLTMVDPEAVDRAYRAGPGQAIELQLGARRSRRYHEPLPMRVRVGRCSDGRFEISGHAAGRVRMGRCVVLESGSIRILTSEYAGPGHDPQVYRHIGLEPAEAQIVVLKCTVGHMTAYRDIMKENLPCECPGPSPSYLDRLDFQHIPRPMYPFDRDMTWSSA